MLLNKNSRSQKILTIAQAHEWQYQEFINFNDAIKQANFGLLNYSQNVIFRHCISADNRHFGLGFNFFDCRAIEPFAIHNCSVIMFNLTVDHHFADLHASFLPINGATLKHASSGVDEKYFERIIALQKLLPLTPHYAFPQHKIFSNNPALCELFLHQHLQQKLDKQPSVPVGNKPEGISTQVSGNNLSSWILAHPNLHIEISNGILLAYQPNHLLSTDDVMPALGHIAELSAILSQVELAQ